jgi:spermidine synthase
METIALKKVVMTPAGPSWVLLLMALGVSGILGQILLWRELVVSYGGNEMSTGIILGNWLLAEAIGAIVFAHRPVRRIHPWILFGLLTVLYGVAIVAAITAARTARGLSGYALGEPVGVGYTALSSLLISAPVAFLHGALFPTAGYLYGGNRPMNDRTAVGTLYLWEMAGTLLGAVLGTWYFGVGGGSYRLAGFLLLVNGVVLFGATVHNRHVRPHCIGMAIAVGTQVLGLALLATAGALHERTLECQWRPLSVLSSHTSPYGNLVVLESDGQYLFGVDNQPVHLLPEPDHAAVETTVLLPLLAHPAPRRVLVIGGGVGGVLKSILCFSEVEVVDYVERDPMLLNLFRRFPTALSSAELEDPRVRLHFRDGRRFLLEEAPVYNLIWLGISEPSTLQANRYFTAEFFSLARRCLSPEGLLILSVRGEIGRLTDDLELLHLCLFETLKQVFEEVRVFPGEGRFLYWASPQLPLGEFTPRIALLRMQEWGRADVGQLPWHLENRLHPGWVSWFEERRVRVVAPVNRDLKPIAVHYALKHHQTAYGPWISAIFRYAARHAFLLSMMVLGVVVFFAWPAWRAPHVWTTRRALPALVMTTGFAGMLLDLLILLTFQSVFGHVYGWIGLLMASFMAGVTVGALVGRRWSHKASDVAVPLLLTETGMLLFCAIFPRLMSGLAGLTAAHWPSVMSLFLGVEFLAGVLTGLPFPLAAAWKLRDGEAEGYAAGVLQASDLLGGWVAGMLGTAFLLPLGGIPGTCGIVVCLKGVSLGYILLGIMAIRTYHGKCRL